MYLSVYLSKYTPTFFLIWYILGTNVLLFYLLLTYLFMILLASCYHFWFAEYQQIIVEWLTVDVHTIVWSLSPSVAREFMFVTLFSISICLYLFTLSLSNEQDLTKKKTKQKKKQKQIFKSSNPGLSWLSFNITYSDNLLNHRSLCKKPWGKTPVCQFFQSIWFYT